MQILTEPKNALVKQYQRFFDYDHIDLVFTDDALWSIADKGLQRETGARGLRSIIENALLDVMFELPSRKDVSKCVITKETIEKGLKPTLVTSAGADTASRTCSPKSPPSPRACSHAARSYPAWAWLRLGAPRSCLHRRSVVAVLQRRGAPSYRARRAASSPPAT